MELTGKKTPALSEEIKEQRNQFKLKLRKQEDPGSHQPQASDVRQPNSRL